MAAIFIATAVAIGLCAGGGETTQRTDAERPAPMVSPYPVAGLQPALGSVGPYTLTIHDLAANVENGAEVLAPAGPVEPLPEIEDVSAAGVTPGATFTPAPNSGSQLTEAEMRALLAEAGAEAEWIESFLAIAWCESKHSPGARGDGGASLGLYQLWTGWAPAAGYAVDDLYEPLINTKVAVYVRTVRGRFGGGGGWTCAGILGIY